ncbi:diphthamide biosynthesis protein 2 [Colletotrichum graminicola]|uniref:2-(3-amino-3-carboxypropyl)histidine synthase subunit 2 n=1 Tax=Colletotrichum graminicola (strain M1.001 / M2 / FGSC 10212) TaxID=645133 RepID=E3QMA4_COLGM|nr:diphthamide biosynthesis protein 2 [Colletotrichum graminicola M1.001]EFQ31992.1 diphthamide biosynthesis protein 2 [Colletotrichum graminicola M1.001]WDK21885.1 diphthamide biosynthesis protein 2 [Colletotrichum graminicola]
MTELLAAPVLSTPAEHTFEDPTPTPPPPPTELRTEDELASVYEIERTAREIKEGGWNRVALQFPDSMLCDASWVAEALTKALGGSDGHRVYILADTSYSACCVDEIAAEHADAQVVVHYGRSCLSPTSRLPVIYVFTRHTLDIEQTVEAFQKEFPDKENKVVVMADVTYQDHVVPLASKLRAAGYTHLLHTEVTHDPAGTIPNRSIVDSASRGEPETDLSQYSLFHISTPPPALLLALQTRMASLHVLSTPSLSTDDPTRTTNALLRRRFARVLTLATAGVVGILVNTLSVSNYLGSVDLLRRRIAEAGKKSYTVVVGKLNAAKLANFAEVDGWVVVGCWESGLVEEDAGFFKPVITPFEMEVALKPESERVWGLEWWGGIEKMDHTAARPDEEELDEDESAPPEYDLRTGRLVASRPMRMPIRSANGAPKADDGERSAQAPGQSALVKREVGEVATINGVLSPGAEYLRSQRTWQGLGTDYDEESSTVVEEGRSGVARGYTVGEDTGRA